MNKRHPKFMLALLLTGGVALILIGLMIYLYSKPIPQKKPNDSGSKLHDFFTNIVSTGQGFFGK